MVHPHARGDDVFYGADLPGLDFGQATVTIAPADTPAQMGAKFAAAVVAEAQRAGHAVAAKDVLIPAFAKGS